MASPFDLKIAGSGSAPRRALLSIVTLGSAQLVSMLLLQIAVVLLIRAVGPAPAGRYNAAVAMTTSLSFLIGWGSSAALIRRGAVDPGAAVSFAQGALAVRLVAYVPFVILTVGLAVLLGWTREAVWLVAVASLVALGTSMQQVAKALLELRRRFTTLAAQGVFHGAAMAALIVVVLWCGGSLTTLLLVNGAMELLLAAVWLRSLGVPAGSVVKFRHVMPVARESVPYVLAGVFYALNFRVDAVAIASLRGEADVGYYTAASRIVMLGFMLPLVVSTVLRSRFFALAPKSPRELASVYAETCRFSAALALPFAVALAVVPAWLVGFLFGDAFHPAATVLLILSPVVVLRALAVPAGDVVTAFGRQHVRTMIEAASAVTNLVLDVVLIAVLGIVGAAVATVVAELLLVTWLRVAAARTMGTGALTGLSLRPIAAAAAMACAIAGLGRLGVHAPGCLVAGAAVYGCLAVPLGVIHVNDLRKLRAEGARS
jgi:O-antigen/teichoic acid export membrane protein